MAEAAVQVSVTVAGWAERARVARAFTAEATGPGHPCGADAALLAKRPHTARLVPGAPAPPAAHGRGPAASAHAGFVAYTSVRAANSAA